MNGEKRFDLTGTHTPDEIKSGAEKIICTMCGKPFDEWDVMLGDNRYDIFVNYGSKYDLMRIRFNFCCECFDRVLDTIIPMCKIDPVADDDWWEHCVREANGRLVICREGVGEETGQEKQNENDETQTEISESPSERDSGDA
ncbi:MAG: hypothetical protein IKX86_01110 [Clostridia bacterium]|nr:hypothetical protein [Clostridia bacterium]MBR5767261.1 hypothetical protein [Clostridia bacterium]